MLNYGRSAVSDILEDNIIYRNLIPIDPDLPGLPDLWEKAGLSSSRVPRKTTADYAAVVACILNYISDKSNPAKPIQKVVFIGDTHLNDGHAFQNICRSGGWTGVAFIAAEKAEPAQIEMQKNGLGTIFLANRWSALERLEEYAAQLRFYIDDQTAVLLDLDKTTLGARGRNDKVIDLVRIEAANQIIRQLLGEDFDERVFSESYQYLNQPEFHPFTADNQDYLVYTCMILGSGLTSLEKLVADLSEKKLESFNQFLSQNQANRNNLPADLRQVHDEVNFLISEGDPTPFKQFRREEFRQTILHMGQMAKGTPVEQILKQEITITQEVRQAALNWKEQGALLFGLSDKPDEASIPNAEMASQGMQSVHRVETDVIGE